MCLRQISYGIMVNEELIILFRVDFFHLLLISSVLLLKLIVCCCCCCFARIDVSHVSAYLFQSHFNFKSILQSCATAIWSVKLTNQSISSKNFFPLTIHVGDVIPFCCWMCNNKRKEAVLISNFVTSRGWIIIECNSKRNAHSNDQNHYDAELTNRWT